MWLRRDLWASTITERARLLAELQAWEQLRDALQAENGRLREDIQRERERANRAVDELLALRGIGPVTPLPQPPGQEDFARMFEEDAGELADLKKRLEAEGAVPVMRESDGSGSG